MRRRQSRSNSSSRAAERRQRVHRDHLGRVAGQAAGVERPAVEVHVVGVAVVGRVHRRDRPQRRRPQRGELDAAEPAVGHAPRRHRAGAPRLRRDPRDHVVAVVLLGLGVLVLRPRPASCRCRAHPGARTRTRRSRGSCSATGPRSLAGRPCGRGCARGWPGSGRAGWGGRRRPRAARRRARSPRRPAPEGRSRRRARGWRRLPWAARLPLPLHPFDTVPGAGQTPPSQPVGHFWRYCREHRGTSSHSIHSPARRCCGAPGTGALGLSAASLLAACGSSSSSGSSASGGSSSGGAITGQAILANYPGWMGKNNLADFAKKYPGRLDQDDLERDVEQRRGGAAVQEQAVRLPARRHERLRARRRTPNLITKLDWSKIPNIKNVAQQFRTAYPWGLPTDYGKVGIAYRPDLVGGATITSWHDLWELIPKYSGQTIFIDLERDCMGSTCKYLGFSSNTTDAGELKKVQDAIVEREAAPEGVPEHERRRRPGQRLDRDGDGLGLRRRASAAEERQDQVGAAGGGRARLSGGLHRGAGHEQDRR